MEAMKNIFVNAINGGNFVLAEMETKIDTMWIKGSLTETERNELLELAAAKAEDINQIDVIGKLADLTNRCADLEQRVYALEHPEEEPPVEPEYPIYHAGDITPKGGIVQFDYDDDGNLDLLQYNGGKASTTLSPGKITGWNVLDPQTLEIIGTFYKGEFTPVGPEPTPEPEEPTGETGETGETGGEG